ncbi:sporulation peptidase YabG [Priestia megaterium]|jgi:spore coat assembly protein|uniref:sporulation peptidase YabG n=1 Tax=Priestia megaterium TaxID=1404 RepID=UPI000BFCB9E2|nr:sporulation peptidase YabG [Priestia megaterium]MBW0934185.1 sporulation peptidase YabG [Priestia megaterium]MCR8867178.1 sporulation peptidase YabG [Priestia megaterium]MDR0133042.1 sporulation peptidase YabG [Priestia megaterium]MDR4222571.1 sporulation peptidase YabG [Priestia megaterium]MDR7207744.1 spore coat assembly protein [Priestia megaterium]
MNIKIGDIVTRPSYQRDLLFRVIAINDSEAGKYATLIGEDVRLIADAPCTDLEVVDAKEQDQRKKQEEELLERSLELIQQDYRLVREKTEYSMTNGYSHSHRLFQIPGKVLHVDGDPNYLRKCLLVYEKIGVPVYGVHCVESEMPEKVGKLIEDVRPDILVLTGHDAYSKGKGNKDDLLAYRHSKHYIKTVQEARKRVGNLDQLVIFAGACQSHFELLIQAGANFASSPSRVNIHALDPVYVVAKLSFTPFTDRINVWDVLRNTLTGAKGLGGVETKGLLRTGMPYESDE